MKDVSLNFEKISKPEKAPGDFAEDLNQNFVISVIFDLPEFPKDFIFPAKTLPGAKFPEPNLKPKYFGERANAAPRDWSRNNHRSGAQISQSGHRMINNALPNSQYQENDKNQRIGLFGIRY